MWIDLIFVVLQSLCVVTLGAVGILEATKRPDGGLNRMGKGLLLSAAFMYVFSMSILHLSSARTQKKSMERIENLKAELLERVMRAPLEIATQAPEMQPTTDLQISKPVSGAVMWRPCVEGQVSDPKTEVWVIIHPVGLSSYWVQSPVSIRSDGTWRASVYIGRAGDIDVGKKFEIMAIADPRQKLAEGRVFSEWPKAKWRSDIVTVIRK